MPPGTKLRTDWDPSSLARTGGQLFVDLFPGTAVIIVDSNIVKMIVRFSVGLFDGEAAE
jgi:hypothetical protein